MGCTSARGSTMTCGSPVTKAERSISTESTASCRETADALSITGPSPSDTPRRAPLHPPSGAALATAAAPTAEASGGAGVDAADDDADADAVALAPPAGSLPVALTTVRAAGAPAPRAPSRARKKLASADKPDLVRGMPPAPTPFSLGSGP